MGYYAQITLIHQPDLIHFRSLFLGLLTLWFNIAARSSTPVKGTRSPEPSIVSTNPEIFRWSSVSTLYTRTIKLSAVVNSAIIEGIIHSRYPQITHRLRKNEKDAGGLYCF